MKYNDWMQDLMIHISDPVQYAKARAEFLKAQAEGYLAAYQQLIDQSDVEIDLIWLLHWLDTKTNPWTWDPDTEEQPTTYNLKPLEDRDEPLVVRAITQEEGETEYEWKTSNPSIQAVVDPKLFNDLVDTIISFQSQAIPFESTFINVLDLLISEWARFNSVYITKDSADVPEDEQRHWEPQDIASVQAYRTDLSEQMLIKPDEALKAIALTINKAKILALGLSHSSEGTQLSIAEVQSEVGLQNFDDLETFAENVRVVTNDSSSDPKAKVQSLMSSMVSEIPSDADVPFKIGQYDETFTSQPPVSIMFRVLADITLWTASKIKTMIFEGVKLVAAAIGPIWGTAVKVLSSVAQFLVTMFTPPKAFKVNAVFDAPYLDSPSFRGAFPLSNNDNRLFGQVALASPTTTRTHRDVASDISIAFNAVRTALQQKINNDMNGWLVGDNDFIKCDYNNWPKMWKMSGTTVRKAEFSTNTCKIIGNQPYHTYTRDTGHGALPWGFEIGRPGAADTNHYCKVYGLTGNSEGGGWGAPDQSLGVIKDNGGGWSSTWNESIEGTLWPNFIRSILDYAKTLIDSGSSAYQYLDDHYWIDDKKFQMWINPDSIQVYNLDTKGKNKDTLVEMDVAYSGHIGVTDDSVSNVRVVTTFNDHWHVFSQKSWADDWSEWNHSNLPLNGCRAWYWQDHVLQPVQYWENYFLEDDMVVLKRHFSKEDTKGTIIAKFKEVFKYARWIKTDFGCIMFQWDIDNNQLKYELHVANSIATQSNICDENFNVNMGVAGNHDYVMNAIFGDINSTSQDTSADDDDFISSFITSKKGLLNIALTAYHSIVNPEMDAGLWNLASQNSNYPEVHHTMQAWAGFKPSGAVSNSWILNDVTKGKEEWAWRLARGDGDENPTPTKAIAYLGDGPVNTHQFTPDGETPQLANPLCYLAAIIVMQDASNMTTRSLTSLNESSGLFIPNSIVQRQPRYRYHLTTYSDVRKQAMVLLTAVAAVALVVGTVLATMAFKKKIRGKLSKSEAKYYRAQDNYTDNYGKADEYGKKKIRQQLARSANQFYRTQKLCSMVGISNYYDGGESILSKFTSITNTEGSQDVIDTTPTDSDLLYTILRSIRR